MPDTPTPAELARMLGAAIEFVEIATQRGAKLPDQIVVPLEQAKQCVAALESLSTITEQRDASDAVILNHPDTLPADFYKWHAAACKRAHDHRSRQKAGTT